MGTYVFGFDETVEVARLVGMLGQQRRVTEHLDGELESDTTHTVKDWLQSVDLDDDGGC